jgi:hypothetical protein
VLRGAASTGAAAIAVGAIGAAARKGEQAGGPRAATAGSLTATAGPEHAQDPIVVHIRDAGSGDIEVFRGTSQARLRDQDLAARIAGVIS